ncbi:MAG TPA: hypothetical protein VNW97_04435, partial [Candidatus Saccharimonadales bacterium]|nr:hypothetical protein [Candidatus Saccharimonadales bacterium]
MVRRSTKTLNGHKKKSTRVPAHSAGSIRRFDPTEFLAQAGLGRTIVDLKKGQTIYSQGDVADSCFYIQVGKVRLGVISTSG